MKTSLLSLLSVLGSAAALDVATSDADANVWASLAHTGPKTTHSTRSSNRPHKRQEGWNPPSDLALPLSEVWQHQLDTYTAGLFGFRNFGWDQIMATGGKINFCVRWESNTPVDEAKRAEIARVANEQYQILFQWLYGYDTFPFSHIDVNVVGWAVRDTNLLQGSTDGIDVYTNTDAAGAPECAPACGRFFHQDGDYSQCPGGEARHYDQSLWLTDGFGGGAGGDWGQRMGSEYFLNALGDEQITILLHEMGHTFGLDDFYDWTPTGITNFIMLAGSSPTVTDFDGWMLRNFWYELSRNRGW